MRFLANENIPGKAVAALRMAGHDVVSVAERSPAITDDEVLAIAIHESRVLLTFDKGFGELAFGRGLPAASGVLLLRIPPIPGLVATYIVRALETGVAPAGKFVVIEADRVRERPLPGPPE